MPNTQAPNKFSALVGQKCPHCRRGPLFCFPWYNLKSFLKMYEHCPHCGQQYEIEPGFFWGAMYISYAFTTGWFLVGLTFYFMYWPPMVPFILFYISFIILTLPINVRYSRTILLHLLSPIKFSKQAFLEGKMKDVPLK